MMIPYSLYSHTHILVPWPNDRHVGNRTKIRDAKSYNCIPESQTKSDQSHNFVDWNENKFSNTGKWSLGDANGDGVTDALDFIEWNANKFMSSDGVSAVPEPGAVLLSFLAMLCLALVMLVLFFMDSYMRIDPFPVR